MTERQFHKYVYTFTVLSEDPIDGDATLGEIYQSTIDGPNSGETDCTVHKMLNGKQMAKALEKQGSDPEFFYLDEHGNDLE